MSEFNEQALRAILKQSSDFVANYIEKHVATVSMNTLTKKGSLIQSTKGGILLDLGFTQKVIKEEPRIIPTIFNIQLGDMSSYGHGPKIVSIWENSFSNSNFFGADKVVNPKFWNNIGYKQFDGNFWLKRK